MIDSNKLYGRMDAGINWIIVIDYNTKPGNLGGMSMVSGILENSSELKPNCPECNNIIPATVEGLISVNYIICPYCKKEILLESLKEKLFRT